VNVDGSRQDFWLLLSALRALGRAAANGGRRRWRHRAGVCLKVRRRHFLFLPVWRGALRPSAFPLSPASSSAACNHWRYLSAAISLRLPPLPLRHLYLDRLQWACLSMPA